MRIGIDLGGTKIEIIALDDGGSTLARERAATPAGDYDRTVRTMAGLVAGVEAKLGRRGTIGVGTPGTLSTRADVLKNSNSVVLNGKPLARDLCDALGRPVRLENDANCFALSEAVDGAAAGVAIVFGLILGTGVGGGVIVDRKVLTGRNRIAGEWGHNPLPWPRPDELPGHRCYCGKHGCIETFLCGAGLAREYERHAMTPLPAHDIAAAAQAGDAKARASLEIYRERLARGLASVVNIVDPDVIVLGGGVSNITAIYDGLPMLVARYAFSDAIDTKVVKAVHGDSSGVRGAAWLWPVSHTFGPMAAHSV
jgi:fructokinase